MNALRIFTRSPGLSAAAVTLIALGIGVNTTLYSMIHGILTKPAPGVEAAGLLTLGLTVDGHPEDPGNSLPNFLDYAAQSKTVRLIARGFDRVAVDLDDGSYATRAAPVTAGYFETLGVRMSQGRSFTPQEERSDASGLAAVISDRFWREQFHGAVDIIGRRLGLNGYTATVVGVAPVGFRGTQLTESTDLWIPLLSYYQTKGTGAPLTVRTIPTIEIMGRLAPGASLRQAQAEFTLISQRLAAAYPETNRNRMVVVGPYSMAAMGPWAQRSSAFLAILAMVAVLTLLLVCSNVANLMLARAAVRQREMAVRRSMGATRWRILRMLLAEGFVISLAAWAAACLFAFVAAKAIPGMIPPNNQGITVDPNFTPDWGVIGYAMLLAVAGTLAFSAAPALRAWKQQLLPWLKSGEQSVAQGRSRLSTVLTITQLALAVLLLTSAGVASRSSSLFDDLDLRFEKNHLLLVTVNTAGSASDAQRNLELLARLQARLRTLPGVAAVSHVRMPPPFAWGTEPVNAQSSRTDGAGEPVLADRNLVGPAYLETLGVRPLLGRDFSAGDRAGTRKVAIVNQNLAEALWPGQSAVGHIMQVAGEPFEVVGVAPNGIFGSFHEEPHPGFFFVPEAQTAGPTGELTFYVRFTGNLDAVAPAVRAALHQADARVPIVYMRSMQTQWEGITGPVLLIAALLTLFSSGSLLVAAIGLYAVVAFNMARRTRDFGVRIALGASPNQIRGMVIREGLLMTAGGLACGFALSEAVGAVLRRLAGVTPADLHTYAGVFALLASAALLACYVPARRAARVSPMEALRQE
jgi:macrolide transport system ATP-binding/permease protein